MNPHSLKNVAITVWLSVIFSVTAIDPASAQPSALDSIQSLIQSPPRDTNDVKNLVILSMGLFHETSFDSSLHLAIQARKLAEKIHFQRGIGLSLLASGYVYKLQGSYPAAIKDFNEAMEIFENLSDNLNIGKSHSFLAQVLQASGQQEQALEHLLEARRYVEKLGHLAGLSVIYLDIGRYHSERANYEVALEYYLLSLKASDSIKAYSKMAMALNNIGVIYERLEKYDKALDYFTQGVELTRKGNIPSKRALLLMNQAGIQIKMNALNSAQSAALEGLSIAQSNGDKEYESIALRILGKLTWKKGLTKEAEEYYRQAIVMSREMNNPDLTMNALVGMTEFWRSTRQFEKARRTAKEALDIAQRLKAKEFEKDLFLEQAKIDSAQGDFRAAFLWHRKHAYLNDSLHSARKTANIAYLQNLVDEKKAEQQPLLKSKENSDAREATLSPSYVIAILTTLLVATLSILIIVLAKLKSKSKQYDHVGEQVEAQP